MGRSIFGLPAAARAAVGARHSLGSATLLAAALIVVAIAASGCNSNVVVGSPTPPPQGPGLMTEVPIGATPWPNGTVGAYGLRIDPSLMSSIPSIVGGNPLVEAAQVEVGALDDPQYAKAFAAFYVAGIGEITDLNWVQVSIAALKVDAQTEDFYTAWRDDWFKASCSQADGIGSTSVTTINDWKVDVATCNGGVDAYALSLDNGILISIVDFGPRRLGHQLIAGIN